MNIAPASLKDYVSPETPMPLRNEHGALLRFVDSAEVVALAEDRAVYGVAKGGRLSHLVTNGVNEQEVVNILARDRAARKLTSQASTTIRREIVSTRAGIFTTFEHVRNQWFGPAERFDTRNGQRVPVYPVVPERTGGQMVTIEGEMDAIAAGVFRDGYESGLPWKESAFA